MLTRGMSIKPLVVEDLRAGYTELVKMVRDEGQVVRPRGYKTWEIEDATFEVRNTRKLMPLGIGRELNPAIGAAEALLLCAGVGSPSLLTSVAGNFHMFLDGGQLHGAYGPRVRGQLESVVSRLRSDRDSRQAIITIWDPAYDGHDGVRDLPCTLSLGFRLRGSGLHMSATMRSNDIWLGLAYDAFMFGQLGWTIANVLGVELTSYRHHAYSLHLYERNAADVDRLLDVEEGHYQEPAGFAPPLHEWGTKYDYEDARKRAEQIYNGELLEIEASPSEWWYMKTLKPYDRLIRKDNFTS